MYLRYIGIALSTVSYGYRWWTSNGFSTVDHSKANVQICTFFFFCMLMIFAWFYYLFKFFRISKLKGSAYLGGWFAFWFSIYYWRFARSCDHLNDSLVPEVKYSNAGGECHWERGSICWHYTIDGIFKPLYWGRTKCESFIDDYTMHKET
jgi:hypothetical protein